MTEITIGTYMPKLINGIIQLLYQLMIYLESPFISYSNTRHLFTIPPLFVEIDTSTIDFIFDIPSFEISMLTMFTTTLLLTILIIGIVKFFINLIK